uniref:Uncharacterized protein n=1 Tax=Pipistrellus kuhlii TaxID=59472 RepID=A0A7J7TW15_PIPKU|nr:hypothetical protein mPipKuh1_009251 [Pipistrellus kuhlii]
MHLTFPYKVRERRLGECPRDEAAPRPPRPPEARAGGRSPHSRPRPSGPQPPTVARGRTEGSGAVLGLAGRATGTGRPAEGTLRHRHGRCLRNGGDRMRRPPHPRALAAARAGVELDRSGGGRGERGDEAGPGRRASGDVEARRSRGSRERPPQLRSCFQGADRGASDPSALPAIPSEPHGGCAAATWCQP